RFSKMSFGLGGTEGGLSAGSFPAGAAELGLGTAAPRGLHVAGVADAGRGALAGATLSSEGIGWSGGPSALCGVRSGAGTTGRAVAELATGSIGALAVDDRTAGSECRK